MGRGPLGEATLLLLGEAALLPLGRGPLGEAALLLLGEAALLPLGRGPLGEAALLLLGEAALLPLGEAALVTAVERDRVTVVCLLHTHATSTKIYDRFHLAM